MKIGWGVAQGNTLEEVGDDVVEHMFPDDMSESEKSLALADLRVKLALAGASYEERTEIVAHVKERLGR